MGGFWFWFNAFIYLGIAGGALSFLRRARQQRLWQLLCLLLIALSTEVGFDLFSGHGIGVDHWLPLFFLLGILLLDKLFRHERKTAHRIQSEGAIALHESEERFRLAFEYAMIGIGLIDLRGRWLKVNRSLCELTGYSEEEMLDRTYLEMTHPEDREHNQEFYGKLFRGEVPSFQLEKRYVRKDGSLRWVLLSSTLVRGPQGNPEYTISQLLDITSRKEAEAEIRLSEQKFNKAFHSLPFPLAITTIERGKLVEVNQAFLETLGFRREEVIGKTAVELGIVQERERRGFIEELLERGAARNHEMHLYRKSREEREGLFSAENIQVDHETLMLVSFNDVTDLRKAERDRFRLQQEQIETLQASDRLKDEFLSVLSHELRTPLNSVMGFGSLLEDEVLGPLNEKQREGLRKILRGAEQMLGMINELLDFARIQAGQFMITPEETDYPSLVEEALDSIRPMAEAKGIRLETELGRLPLPCLDRTRIRQVLSNLLSNAVKFTPQGGWVCIRAFAEEGKLVTEVSDDGIGISAEDLPKLFQPFRQLDMGLTRKAGGVGLGLSVSKGIVLSHGGCIEAASEGIDRGTTVRFSLPLKK